MKILLCCPKCGCEDLEFSTPTTTTNIKCLNKGCNNTFHINESNYNTREYEPTKIRFKGKMISKYIPENNEE